jgi:hypothetical protein
VRYRDRVIRLRPSEFHRSTTTEKKRTDGGVKKEKAFIDIERSAATGNQQQQFTFEETSNIQKEK